MNYICRILFFLSLFLLVNSAQAIDVGIVSIDSPGSTAFNNSSTPIKVTVKNFDSQPIGSHPVIRYWVNGGREYNQTIPSLAAGASQQVTLNQQFDFSKVGTYEIHVETYINSDMNWSNNSKTKTIYSLTPEASSTEITSFPYLENFEGASANNWTSSSHTGSTPFSLGTPVGTGSPAKNWIVGAASGSNAWVTGLSGFYTSSKSQVLSPLFDLRDIPLAEVSLKVAWESSGGFDGANLQSSIDDVSWDIVGAQGDPNNWYNNGNVVGLGSTDNDGWSGYKTAGDRNPVTEAYATSGSSYHNASATVVGSGGYVTARNILQGGEKTRLRIYFATTAGSDEGFAFDDFGISAAATLSATTTLLVDANSNGLADQGDTVRLTATLSNLSSNFTITNLSYSDAIADTKLSLKVGTVTTTQGSVASGNTGGNTSVSVNVGTIATNSSVTVKYDLLVGTISSTTTGVCSQGTVVADQFDGVTNDPATATPADSSCAKAFGMNASLNYSSSAFNESVANDGSIANSVTATVAKDTFAVTSGAMTAGVHFTATNVPNGLTLVVTGTSSTTATLQLAGNAAKHTNAQDVDNLTVAFKDAAFGGRPASMITGSTKSDFFVNFGAAPEPAPTTTQIAGIVTIDGKPVGNAVVYIEGLGSVTTDANGYFILSGAKTGTMYTVVVQKSGASFSSETDVAGGELLDIGGSEDDFNPFNCRETDISKRLGNGARNANILVNKAAAAYTRLGLTSNRSDSLYSSFLESSQSLPSVTLRCPDSAGCSSVNLKPTRATMLRKLTRLRQEALSANRFVRSRDKRSASKARTVARQIRRKFSSARRAVKNLPGTTFSCENPA